MFTNHTKQEARPYILLSNQKTPQQTGTGHLKIVIHLKVQLQQLNKHIFFL